MNTVPVHPFGDLFWYKVSAELVNTRVSFGMKAHPISVIEAIVKAVTIRAFGNARNRGTPAVLFHISGKNYSLKLREGIKLTIEILFTRVDETGVKEWTDAFSRYFSEETNQNRNFSLVSLQEPEKRTWQDLAAESGNIPVSGEIALNFVTPLPFKPWKKRNRTYLDKEQFISLIEKHFSVLFGQKFRYEFGEDDFSILPYYWKYIQIPHASVSQPGNTQYINGCVGSLYIKGSFASLLPFLILGSELHISTKLSNAQGCYKLLANPSGHFNTFFPQKQILVSIIKDVLAEHDEPVTSPDEAAHLLYNDEKTADELYLEIHSGAWQPGPYTAFPIRKKNKNTRIVEQLSTKDYIVQKYLLHTISRPFDRFFEESSIGFRKGYSRNLAIDMVKNAVSQGYQYVIESDIEDFFPSVDLELLESLLQQYLPEKDALLKSLLIKCLRAGYSLDGKVHERNQGLAQGSPLSPILANLYLDAFDEQLQEWGVRLIRYADDFIILTKTKEEAITILAQTEDYLSWIGLRVNREKTGIHPVSEGFHFLGIQFEKSGVRMDTAETIKRLKKPLYITDRYLFLALNGEALDIYKNWKIIQTIPLRRVSEIIVMERATFSTALLRYCTERNIPFTITLDSGYFITTVKPDSKEYYKISTAHSLRYNELSETEILTISKEIVAAKIRNYIPLYRQRYTKGTNRIIRDIENTLERVYQASTLNELRGHEGIASRKNFERLNDFIDEPQFKIKKRNRKNPDRINSLLNFGYYLVFSRLNATVRATGLNPYLGFLHDPGNNYESLVSDLVELFRARIDRYIIRLLNLKIIKPDDFTFTNRGMYLKKEAVGKFLKQFETELEKTTAGNSLNLKEQIYLQVLIIKNWVLDKGSLTFYEWKTDHENQQ